MSHGERYVPSIGFSPQAARLMRRAEEAATQFGQRAVCNEHLLLELLREDHGPASQVIDLYADRLEMCRQLEGALAATPIKADNETKRRLGEESRRAHEARKREAENDRRLFREWLATRHNDE
jgi:ATP-dependent Clp protease ATP-binding subunit ClpA